MASFGGTTQKCKVCEKTVYLVEQLTADNKVYHKTCFRCHHCKGTLKLSNYSSYEGVLYCKPHFDQLFKMTGSLNKSFEGQYQNMILVSKKCLHTIQLSLAGAPRSARIDISLEPAPANSKISSLFAGTQDKCISCSKKVYLLEKVAVDGNSYHKACFKCSHGGCVISPSNYIAHEQRLYCRHHHMQLFKQKGNFSKLDRFGEPMRVNGTA